MKGRNKNSKNKNNKKVRRSKQKTMKAKIHGKTETYKEKLKNPT